MVALQGYDHNRFHPTMGGEHLTYLVFRWRHKTPSPRLYTVDCQLIELFGMQLALTLARY